MYRRLVELTLAAMVLASEVQAADIELMPVPGLDVPFVILKGPIEAGDAERFYEATKGSERATVILESPGGSVKEALEIGANIRAENYATLVTEGSGCFSACGLIWVSGVRRYMSEKSLIGFHAAYKEENGEYRESGVANAEIGSFLTHLGLRIEAIRFFTMAGPDNFEMLTPSRARALGIEVFQVESDRLIDPSAKPTVDHYARRFVLLGVLSARCGPYLAPSASALRQAMDAAFEAGNALVPSETWIKLWTSMLDGLDEQNRKAGTLALCVGTEAWLRSEKLETGIYGPSFDCQKASTTTERAICGDATLWAKDRTASAVYFWVRSEATGDPRRQILEAQRIWLKQRNSCGAASECLHGIYDKRLTDMSAIELPR